MDFYSGQAKVHHICIFSPIIQGLSYWMIFSALWLNKVNLTLVSLWYRFHLASIPIKIYEKIQTNYFKVLCKKNVWSHLYSFYFIMVVAPVTIFDMKIWDYYFSYDETIFEKYYSFYLFHIMFIVYDNIMYYITNIMHYITIFCII